MKYTCKEKINVLFMLVDGWVVGAGSRSGTFTTTDQNYV